MKKSLNVCVLSMVIQRDWVIDQMIADELNRRGHKACVRNYLLDGRDAVIIERPDVCIIPVVRCEYTRDFAIRLKQWGVKVVARRSEAGVSRKQYEKLPRHWQLDQIGRYDYKDLIDLELVWSKEFGSILIDEGKIRPEQVRFIGGITLDPYFKHDVAKLTSTVFKKTREEWLREKGFDPDKRLIFFVAGFVNADRPEYNLPEAPVDDPIHNELYLRDKVCRNKWIETIKRLNETGQYNILVRPHHGEDMSTYSFPKPVLVSIEGSAAENLYYSDCLIHSGSTMAVEAHILNKVAFCLGNTAQDELIRDVSPTCETADELINALKTAEYGKSNALISSIEDLKKHFYGLIDGKAHERVSDAACEFSPNGVCIPDKWPEDELKDYASKDVIRIKNVPVTHCSACKKSFQNMTGRKRVPCPHCGIAIETNFYQCSR